MPVHIGRIKAAATRVPPVINDPTPKRVTTPEVTQGDKMKSAWRAFKSHNTVAGTIASLTPVGLVAGAVDKVVEGVKDRVLTNVNPSGYNSGGRAYKTGFATRALNTIVLNNVESKRATMDKKPSAEFKERQDLLSLYLGRNQKSNSIGVSSYRPTVGDNPKHQYVTSALAEGEIGQGVKNIPNLKSNSLTEIKDKVLEAIKDGTMGIGESGKGGFHVNLPSMNEATMDVGEDKKGYYISYSDRFDLNPLRGTASILKNSPKAAAVAKAMGVSAIEDLNPIGRPVNIYGRIYIDKKTGKVIR